MRRLWRNLHLWIGLSLFLVLAPLGLTGSLLVFDDGLDRLLHPVRYAVSGQPGDQSAQAYIGAARMAFGERALPAQLRMPAAPGQPVIVTGTAPGAVKPGQRPAQLTAWLDPATGKVLDVANPRQQLRGMIHQLHGNLFMAQPGRKVVGWLGVAMLISSVTGLCIWWPRNNAVLKGLRWTRSPSGFSNLHHMAGFWICAPLAILSFSGAFIAFPEASAALRPAVAARPERAQQNAFTAPLAAPQLGADAAVAAALAQAGGAARVTQLTLPTEGDRPAWRVQLKGDGGSVQVRVEDTSGKAKLQSGGPAQGPEGRDPLTRFMRNLHDGDGMGPLWRAIIVLAGLAPTLLGVTGTVMWLASRRRAAAG